MKEFEAIIREHSATERAVDHDRERIGQNICGENGSVLQVVWTAIQIAKIIGFRAKVPQINPQAAVAEDTVAQHRMIGAATDMHAWTIIVGNQVCVCAIAAAYKIPVAEHFNP